MAAPESTHDAPQAGVVRVEKSDVHFTCDSMDTITRAGLKATADWYRAQGWL